MTFGQPAFEAARLRGPAALRHRGAAGATLLEISLVMGLVGLIGASAFSALRAMHAQRAGREAARALLHDLQEVAQRARVSGTARAVRFAPGGTADTFVEFEDGNGNGIRLAEVEAETDPPVGPPRLAFREGHARLAIVRPVPSTDHASTLPAGASPIRFGVSPLVIFTPRRTGSSGSLYIVGPDGRQYAIRILGTTMRWRLLCLDEVHESWVAC